MTRLIDVHSHWSTRRGYALRSQEELQLQNHTWRSKVSYRSEAEMADDLRAAGVKAILDFGFTKFESIEVARETHDYGFAFEKQNPDVCLGHWFHFQAEQGKPALAEFRRCIDHATGFAGLAVSGSGGLPPSEPAWDPFYKLCIEANVPALIFVGTTGLGSGMPGGNGIILDNCHPRHLDFVAARYPRMTIVAARPGWPWQTETNAVIVHKANIWYELHGWSPKYFSDDLKHEISRRFADRIMFGADYPMLSYERLISDWRALGYSEEMLAKVFTGNAARFLSQLRNGAAVSSKLAVTSPAPAK
jgi:predicted TIM-barrel fold metal-dependent hydrolase